MSEYIPLNKGDKFGRLTVIKLDHIKTNYLNFFKIMKVLKKDVFDSCITINSSIKISDINNKELSFC